MESKNYERKRKLLYKVPLAVSVSLLAGFVTLVFVNPYAAIVVGNIVVLLVVYKSFINLPVSIYGVKKIKETMRGEYFDEIKDRYEDIFHVVLVPAYKEDKEELYERKVISVNKSQIADNISVVFVLEENDHKAHKIVAKLEKKYKNVFMIIHPPEEGIVRGKSSAMAYAGKLIGTARYGRRPYLPEKSSQFTIEKNMETFKALKELTMNKEVVVHDIDIDFWFPHNYFEYFTKVYLETENRKYAVYQPIIALVNNIHNVRFFSRDTAVTTTYESINSNLFALLRSPFSSYGVSLDLLDAVGYWRPDVIQEDSSLYWKIRMKFGRKKIKLVPLSMPVFGNAIEALTWKEEFVSQWKQLTRWGVGASDLADIWLSKSPLSEKLSSLPYWIKFHLLWETSGLIGLISMTLSMMLGYGPVPGIVYFLSYFFTLIGTSITSKALDDMSRSERELLFEDEKTTLLMDSPSVERAYPSLFDIRFPATFVNRESATATALLIVVTESSKKMIPWINLGYIASLTISSICALHGAYKAFKYDLRYVVAPK